MLAEHLHAAVTGARAATTLDAIAGQLFAANAAGHIGDAEASAIEEAIRARRAAFRAPSAGMRLGGIMPGRIRRLRPRSADRIASTERRRRHAASGALPPQIAARFTLAEQAVLAVIGRQCHEAGACDWPVDKIAAMAGVSASTVKRAVRAAEEAGIVHREQRRIRYDLSLPSKLRVISPEWRAWLARGPKPLVGQKETATNTYSYNQQTAHRTTRSGYRSEAEGAHGRRHHAGSSERAAAR